MQMGPMGGPGPGPMMGPGGPMMGPGGPMMGPGGGMMGGGMGMGMMGNMPAIAATSEYVYVVQGNMLYQYNAKTLKLANKEELPRPAPKMGAGDGGGMGMPGQPRPPDM